MTVLNSALQFSFLQHLLNEHERVLSKVSKNLVNLLVPHVTTLKEALDPLLTTLTWSSIQAHSYFEQGFAAIRTFETLIDRCGRRRRAERQTRRGRREERKGEEED